MRWSVLLLAVACARTMNMPPPSPLAVPKETAAQPASAPERPDASTVEVGGDAGIADAGLADAGLADAGLADAGLADAGTALAPADAGGPPLVDLASPITAAGMEPPAGPARPPEGRPRPASKTVKNVKLLGDLTSERFMAAMQSMRANLGQKCAMCHLVAEKDFPSDEKKEKLRARDMIRMTAEIDRRTFEGKNRVTCFTCHRGEEEPPKMNFNQALPKPFLRLSPEQLKLPAEQVFKDVRELKGTDAKNFGLIMGWFAQELGVQCTHCHVDGDFVKDTPKKTRAREMLQMAGYIGKEFYPPNDSPVGCGTCHRGHAEPPRTAKDIP